MLKAWSRRPPAKPTIHPKKIGMRLQTTPNTTNQKSVKSGVILEK